MSMLTSLLKNPFKWRNHHRIIGKRLSQYEIHGSSILVKDNDTSNANGTNDSQIEKSLSNNKTVCSSSSLYSLRNNDCSMSSLPRQSTLFFSTSVMSSSVSGDGNGEERIFEGMFERYRTKQPSFGFNMNSSHIDHKKISNTNLLTPKLWLSNHYQKMNPSSPMIRPSYRVFCLENEQKVLRWIAIVSCPTSDSTKSESAAGNNMFPSGTILSPNIENNNSTCEILNIPITNDQSTADKKIYLASEDDLSSNCSDNILSLPIITYRSKKDAEQAAAARAIDCLVRRDYNTQQNKNDRNNDMKPPQLLCHEEPHELSSNEIFLVKNLNAICHHGYLDEQKTITTKSINQNEKDNRSTPSMAKAKVTNNSADTSRHKFELSSSFFLESSNNKNIKEFLSRYYDSMNVKQTSEDNDIFMCDIESTQAQVAIHADDDPNKQKSSNIIYPKLNNLTLHHAKFSCPLTGESFQSGTLLDQRTPNDTYRIGDKIYYTKIKNAEYAAYARALDCFSYRQYHDNGNNENKQNDDIIRTCLEEPYLLKSSITALDDSYTDSTNNNHFSDWSEENNDNSYDVDGFEDDDEYSIQLVPGESSSSLLSNDINEYNSSQKDQQSSLSTMERILEAWADIPTTPNPTDYDSSFSKYSYEKEGGRRKRREEALSNALAWYKRMEYGIQASQNSSSAQNQKSQFNPKVTTSSLRQTPVSVISCNAILNTLANVNYESLISYPYHSHRNINSVIQPQRDTSRNKRLKGTQKKSSSPTINPNIPFQDIESLAQQIIHHMSQDPDGNTSVTNHDGDSSKMIDNDVLLSPWSRRPNTETYNAYIKCLRRSTPLETAIAAEDLLDRMIDSDSGSLPPPNVGTYNAVLGLWSAIRTNTNDCDNSNYSKVKEIYQQLLQQHEFDNAASIRPNRQTFITCLSSLANHSNIKFAHEEALSFWIPEMRKFAIKYDDNHEFNTEDTGDIYHAILPWSGGQMGRQSINNASFPFPWDDYSIIFQHGFHPNNHSKEIGCDNSVIYDHDYYTEKAIAMEDWVHKHIINNKTKISPKIETYESMIQAWVRTGTRDGLKKAESWAMQICSNSDINGLYPRASTFHPIIAAWALCGDEQGYVKVQEWMGKISPKELDSRCLTAQILALKSFPLHLFKKYGLNKTYSNEKKEFDYNEIRYEDMEKLLESSFDASKECMNYLEQVCKDSCDQRQSLSNSLLVDAYNFGHVLNLWRDTAILASLMIKEKRNNQKSSVVKNKSNIEYSRTYAISQMIRTIELFDQLVEYHRQMDNKVVANGEGIIAAATLDNDKDDSDFYNQSSLSKEELESPSSEQLIHFFRVSPYFYSQAVSSLLQLDHYESGTKNSDESIFVRYFPQVERLLRHSEDCKIAMSISQSNKTHEIGFMTKDQPSSQVINQFDLYYDRNQYDDSFDYGSLVNLSPWDNLKTDLNENRIGIIDSKQDPNLLLYSNILKGCMELSQTTYYGDVIRVAMLIFDRFTSMTESDNLEYTSTFNEKYNATPSMHNDFSKKEITDLYVTLLALIGKTIPQEEERCAIIRNILIRINDIKSSFDFDLKEIEKSVKINSNISKEEVDEIFRSKTNKTNQFRKKSVSTRMKRNSDLKTSSYRRRRRTSKSNSKKRNIRKYKALSSNS